MKFKITLLAALLLSATTTQAALVHTDWKTAGDGQVTLSEETGLEWLKLSNTYGLSINQVKAQLDTTYAGWRLPTSTEVGEMITSHFSTIMLSHGGATSGFSATQVAQGNEWLSYSSLTHSTSAYSYAYGLFVNADNEVDMTGAQTRKDGTRVDVYHGYHASVYTQDYIHNMYAVYLVSDGGSTYSSLQDPSMNANNPNAPSNVSVAFGGLALSSMGLILLGGIRRRQQ